MDEPVTAEVGEDGLLAAVRIDPRAMRLYSAELAGHVVEAVRAAQREHEQPPRDSPGLDVVLQRLDELEAQADKDFDYVNSRLDDSLRRYTE
ncbi:hypothetical protein E1292_07795 [Nonomuraea deserti]|uniref:YbaB/EbfC family DNA-binding protein n=1 Tax=Nonomuraea deserti TaxID=1848322 RepID=A0A4R4WAR0_9ACTN|nr:hypothetical protein [Nonomuraea deserti]TDD10400.1 hypothetical protein E1292_07795 [Nonomuraea deserti]